MKPSNWPIDEFPSKPGRSEDGSGRKISMVIAIVRGTDIDRYRYLDAPIDRLSPGSDDLLSTNHGRMRSLVEIDEMEGEPRIFGDPPICPTESGDGQKFSHIRWVWSRHGSGIRGRSVMEASSYRRRLASARFLGNATTPTPPLLHNLDVDVATW